MTLWGATLADPAGLAAGIGWQAGRDHPQDVHWSRHNERFNKEAEHEDDDLQADGGAV